ncbi:MAG: ABC transporter ATP-binding protein [Ignavibacteria bacterium]
MAKNIELKCKMLGKHFGNKAIFSNLSFKLTNTQSLVVTGRNGTGKSTLLKILATLIKPDVGKYSMSIDGIELEKNKFFKHIGMLAPYINLYDELTGYENLMLFGQLRNSYFTKEDKNRVLELLSKVNLYTKRNEYFRNYSSGMKQRLKLAFAIQHSPSILLLDEPRTNLDVEGINIVYDIIEEQKKSGIVIIATNDLDDINLCIEKINIEDFNSAEFLL